MVTYNELFLLINVIISVISLIYNITKDNKKK